jgi:hypothetical protein
MTTIDTEGLHDAALVIGTAFPVLAVAYYSAARGMLDDKLQADGPEWNVDMPTPEWAHNKIGRFLIQLCGNVRFNDDKQDLFPFNERFKLSTDRGFMLAFPLGFVLTLAYLLFSWRWALALSIVLLQLTINILILFGTQVSMIRLASAIADPRFKQSQKQPPKSFSRSSASPLDTRPMAALIRASRGWAHEWALRQTGFDGCDIGGRRPVAPASWESSGRWPRSLTLSPIWRQPLSLSW